MRPEGWKNPYPYNPNPIPKLNNTAYNAYEAGADAYEEGLKKQGLYGEMCEDYIIWREVRLDDPDWAEAFYKSIKGKGWLVFIEEEV